MQHERFAINIDGEEVNDLYPDIISLAVELDEELAALCRLHLVTSREPDGLWRYLDDARLQIWREFTVAAGFDDGVDEIFDGVITHVRPAFGPDLAGCTLEIWAMDRSVLLDRVDLLKDWPNKKDSDIAAEIFNRYGLTPVVEDTTVIHEEVISTIIQRETDMQFLRRLALRNGYGCYVEGKTGYFQPPQLDQPPQPVLAVHFGDETNVSEFALEVDALAPVQVAMQQIDRGSKEVLEMLAEQSRQPRLGSQGSTDLPAGIEPALSVAGGVAATSLLEMTALCEGLYHQREWFVSGEGEINGNAYGQALRPRRTVTIKGIGETYSGVYYVTHVTHSFTRDGYSQYFRVKRNALLPDGSEDFRANGIGGLF